MFQITRVDANCGQDPMRIEQEALQGEATLSIASCQTPEEIIRGAKTADVIITHGANLTAQVLEGLPKCKAVVRYGVGYDSVDVAAATACGILVINVPDFCFEEVSNHVMAFLLAACKKLALLHKTMRGQGWDAAKDLQEPMHAVYGQTLGVIGCGNLGRKVAEKAKAFGLNVIGYDKYLPLREMERVGITSVELTTLLRQSDFITLHVGLTEETYHMIDAAALGEMKESCILINTSRGNVVDEPALIAALNSKRIAMACLDVYEQEPIHPENPLLEMGNVLLTPHCASYSDDSFRRLKTTVIQEALRVRDGIFPNHIVNREVLDSPALRFCRQDSNV